MGSTHQFATASCKREELDKWFIDLVKQTQYERGHGGYTGSFAEARGLSIRDRTFASYAEAEEYIYENAQKWEDAIAVQFRAGEQTDASKKKQLQLRERYNALYKKYEEACKKAAVDFKGAKSKTAGCKACGSKLSRQHIKIPNWTGFPAQCICGASLYSESVMKKLAGLKAKAEEAKKEADAYKPVYKDNNTKWLVGGCFSC